MPVGCAHYLQKIVWGFQARRVVTGHGYGYFGGNCKSWPLSPKGMQTGKPCAHDYMTLTRRITKHISSFLWFPDLKLKSPTFLGFVTCLSLFFTGTTLFSFWPQGEAWCWTGPWSLQILWWLPCLRCLLNRRFEPCQRHWNGMRVWRSASKRRQGNVRLASGFEKQRVFGCFWWGSLWVYLSLCFHGLLSKEMIQRDVQKNLEDFQLEMQDRGFCVERWIWGSEMCLHRHYA